MTAAMFEGIFLAGLPESPFSADGAEDDSLKAITWSDLRARLEAARDLRATLHERDEADGASFDVPAARRIASLADGKDRVNPTDLANGKGTRSNEGASHDAALGGDLRI
jgi:hypothetical protein